MGRTIEREVELRGIGLHTGQEVVMRIKPREESGYLFRRVDLDPPREIQATVENVVSGERGVVLGNGDVKIYTVEHVLSALYGLGVNGAVIELNGPEPPALDGSSQPIAEALKKAGFKGKTDWALFDEQLVYEKGRERIVYLPSDSLRVSYGVEYDHPVLNTQFASCVINEETYLKEIAPARTYIILEDVEKVRERGYAKGGSLENTIVFKKDGIMNPPLRFPNEPARHKILDFLGDLALSGYLVRGDFYIERSGHKGHIDFVRMLRGRLQAEFLDIKEILKFMPHRYPFLLIDKIKYLTEEEVIGIKNVTINEPFFPGHFPGDPIMPGVLIIEAMAQTGGFLLLHRVGKREGLLLFFSGIDGVRFRRPVRPGDTLTFHLRLLRFGGKVAKMQGVAKVGKEVVAEATLMATLVPR